MIGIRVKALAEKQAKVDVRKARLGMLPLIPAAMFFGMAIGFHYQLKHDSGVEFMLMNGTWTPMAARDNKMVPLRKIKCVGPCSMNRTGETVTILTFPEHECDPLPGWQDPDIKRMRMRVK